MIQLDLFPKKYSVILLAFFSLVLVQTAAAQSQNELEKTMEEFRVALTNPDEATLLRLTSKDLSYGHSGGKIENQAEFIKVLIGSTVKYLTVTTSDQTIQFVDDLALVRQNFLADIQNGENLIKLDLGVLLIWKKEKSGWQLLARQGFKR